MGNCMQSNKNAQRKHMYLVDKTVIETAILTSRIINQARIEINLHDNNLMELKKKRNSVLIEYASSTQNKFSPDSSKNN